MRFGCDPIFLLHTSWNRFLYLDRVRSLLLWMWEKEFLTLAMFAKCPCQHCGNHIEVEDEHWGTVVDCPHCNLKTQIGAHPKEKSIPKKRRNIDHVLLPLTAFCALVAIGYCTYKFGKNLDGSTIAGLVVLLSLGLVVFMVLSSKDRHRIIAWGAVIVGVLIALRGSFIATETSIHQIYAAIMIGTGLILAAIGVLIDAVCAKK